MCHPYLPHHTPIYPTPISESEMPYIMPIPSWERPRKPPIYETVDEPIYASNAPIATLPGTILSHAVNAYVLDAPTSAETESWLPTTQLFLKSRGPRCSP